MDEDEEADHAREREVRRDHQGPLAQPVDDEAAEWSDEPREREHEEDESGGTVRPRQHLRPDAEDDDHRPVAEHRHELARHEEAHVAPLQQCAHQPARVTQKSPLTVLPRTTSVGPSPAAPGCSLTVRFAFPSLRAIGETPMAATETGRGPLFALFRLS